MFDGYHKWLSIPLDRRPPTHYQLLGISPEERDPEVINVAAVRQSAFVRNFQVGKHAELATRILNEIAAAKVCLADPIRRAAYDKLLALRAPASGAPPYSPRPLLLAPLLASDDLALPPAGSATPVAAMRLSGRTGRRPQPAWVWWAGSGLVAALVLAIAPLSRPSGEGQPQAGAPVASAHDASPAVDRQPRSDAAASPESMAARPDASLASETASPPNQPAAPAKAAPGPPPPATTADPAAGLAERAILLFSFDSAAGFRQGAAVRTRDLSGHQNHGTIYDAVESSGRVGEALAFFEQLDFVDGGNGRTLDVTGALSISAWVRPVSDSGCIVGKDDWDGPDVTRGFVLRYANMRPDFTIGSGGWRSATAAAAIPRGAWSHLAGVFDGKELVLYVHGQRAAFLAYRGPIDPSPYPLSIGNASFDAQRGFAGAIDEVAIFPLALSPEQVQAIYQRGLNGRPLVDE